MPNHDDQQQPELRRFAAFEHITATTPETEPPPRQSEDARDELAQRQRNVRILELLEQSHDAHARGDIDRAKELFEQTTEIDGLALSAIRGGMLIGAIPTPDEDEWAHYLHDQRMGCVDSEASDE